MSNQINPLAIKPRFWHDPNKIKFEDLYKYSSRDMAKLQQTQKNYKGSMMYIAGILGGCLIIKALVDNNVNKHIFGENQNGGTFLRMWTTNTDFDMNYNREFQRMRYLTEEPAGSDPVNETSDQQLSDLGWRWNPRGNNVKVVKTSPHYKYY